MRDMRKSFSVASPGLFSGTLSSEILGFHLVAFSSLVQSIFECIFDHLLGCLFRARISETLAETGYWWLEHRRGSSRC